jgi:hypothetical protein
MQLIKAFAALFTTKRININADNSDRNLAIAIGQVNATPSRSYDFGTNPTGSTRLINADGQFKILSGAPTITQPFYGSNLKIELNGTTGTVKTGGVFAINCYSQITGSGHTVDRNVGISVLADCGSNLAGTTVTTNTAIEAIGLASRGTTTVTTANAIVVTCPNHGTIRKGIQISAEGTTGLGVGTNNIAFENLGTSRFVGVATFVNSPTFVDGFVAQANSVCSGLLFTNGRRGALRIVTSNYTVNSSDETIVVNATSGAITITMPNASTSIGGKFTIIKNDSSPNAVTVTPVNASSRTLATQYSFVSCICDGTTWLATS